ncbi:MAG: ABC transporter permease [Saccharofermentanales bacterium]|nr:ABC transporter permease [Clostridiaceae bacterium]
MATKKIESQEKVITADLFRTVGKSVEEMEAISRPSLTFWQEAWLRIRKDKAAFIGLIILTVYVILAIFAPMVSRYEFDQQDAYAMKQSFSAEHWFGTDSLGRDLWVRIWVGARVSLSIGFIAAFINSVIGTILGGFSGYIGGKFDMILMRIIDIIYGIPALIVNILVMVVLGPGIKSLIIAMVITGWAGACRFTRGEVYRLKEQEFVLAARVLGESTFMIIVREIIPNLMGLIITNLAMAIPAAIFREAFLSYIGLGIAPPNASWGVLAKEGTAMIRLCPHMLYVPAFFICTTVLAFNLLGNGLRDAFDPRMRGTD